MVKVSYFTALGAGGEGAREQFLRVGRGPDQHGCFRGKMHVGLPRRITEEPRERSLFLTEPVHTDHECDDGTVLFPSSCLCFPETPESEGEEVSSVPLS